MFRRPRATDATAWGRNAVPLAATLRPSRSWADPGHPYSGRVGVLATKHDKLPLIAPPLANAVGLRVNAVAVDTDSLGTFTGDIPRQASPLDTAIAKARLGMSAAGQSLGLASEGSIGPDSAMAFVNADREIVVLVDDDNEIVVWESHASLDIIVASTSVGADEDMASFLSRADFPNHQLIVRPNRGALHPIYKGICSIDALAGAVRECAGIATDHLARVETDMRAHACPSRRAVIAAAAERLATRIATRCPSCRAPGWGRVHVVLGVPCARCGTEVARPRAEVDGCPSCEYTRGRPLISPQTRVDPGECLYCNP